MNKLLAGIAALGFIMCSTAAVAGTAITGTAAYRSEALAQARRHAMEEAQRRGTCITPANPKDCYYDKQANDWTCTVYVANHRGSCSR